MRLSTPFAYIIISILLSSCTSSKLVSSWHDPSFDNSQPAKVLIIAIAREETKRHIFEDTFADSLTSTKVEGIPSYTISQQSEDPDMEALRRAINKSGADTILITHLVGGKEQGFYQPARVVVGSNSYPELLNTYYPFIFRVVHAPGVYVENVTVLLETNIYDTKTEKLIWTARSESKNPVMTRDYYQELINLFIRDLEDKNLL